MILRVFSKLSLERPPSLPPYRDDIVYGRPFTAFYSTYCFTPALHGHFELLSMFENFALYAPSFLQFQIKLGLNLYYEATLKIMI